MAAGQTLRKIAIRAECCVIIESHNFLLPSLFPLPLSPHLPPPHLPLSPHLLPPSPPPPSLSPPSPPQSFWCHWVQQGLHPPLWIRSLAERTSAVFGRVGQWLQPKRHSEPNVPSSSRNPENAPCYCCHGNAQSRASWCTISPSLLPPWTCPLWWQGYPPGDGLSLPARAGVHVQPSRHSTNQRSNVSEYWANRSVSTCSNWSNAVSVKYCITTRGLPHWIHDSQSQWKWVQFPFSFQSTWNSHWGQTFYVSQYALIWLPCQPRRVSPEHE